MSDQKRFNNAAGAPGREAVGPPQQTAPEWKISAEARAEIDNAQRLEAALDAHDLKWKGEQRKIATASDPFPDFDLGSRAHRNILSEYEERRTVWEIERGAIEKSFAKNRENIRSAAPTLSGEFSGDSRDAQGKDARDFSFTAPERDAHRAGPDMGEARDAVKTL